MTKEEFLIVKKLQEQGYMAILRLGEDGYFLKVKRALREPTKDEKDINGSQSIAIDSKAIATAQASGYYLKEINVEPYDRGVNDRSVPYLFFVKKYQYE